MMSEDNKNVSEEQTTEARRDFIKKAAYIAPVVMTMTAMPALANVGSAVTAPPQPAP